jgi:hypothetical protein
LYSAAYSSLHGNGNFSPLGLIENSGMIDPSMM